MLVISRKYRETFMVGDDVNITILGVNGNQVRIGINAPKEVAVHREEVYLRIQQEKKQEKFSKAGLISVDNSSNEITTRH